MFKVHIKDSLRFWLLLSYRPWRDRVFNGHSALPEENILQLPEIHLGRMPGLRGKSHSLCFFPCLCKVPEEIQFWALNKVGLGLLLHVSRPCFSALLSRVPCSNPRRPGHVPSLAMTSLCSSDCPGTHRDLHGLSLECWHHRQAPPGLAWLVGFLLFVCPHSLDC